MAATSYQKTVIAMGELPPNRSLLHTRIHRPNTCSDVVVRTRLFEQLNANLDNPLTLISAPAGYGKTTLVTSWLDHVLADADSETAHPFCTAWLSLNPVDNDPHTFFSALVAAIESAFPDACADIRAVLQSGQPVVLTWLTTAIALACAALPGRLVLIVDDYYLITNDAVHAAVAMLIRNWGAGVHTVIVTRANPPLRLAQLRARQQILEIRSHHLQFEREELAAFMRAQIKDDLPTTVLDTLHARTEGWAVGVRLAAVSLGQRGDVASFISEFERNSNRYIMDYLVDEVLGEQPAEMQAFLLHTAMLPRMSGPLCAAMVEGMDAPACQTMLEQLEQHNLFIVNLDDYRGWYRYHHQFQAFLVNRLRLQVGEAGIRKLRLCAADWLSANGHPEEAIVEYVDMGELSRAAELIEDHLVVLQNDEQWPSLSRWLSHLPDPVLHQRPGLLIALGWVKRFQNADEQIRGLVAQAESLLKGADEAQQSFWQAQVLALKTVGNIIPDAEERISVANQARRLALREHVWVRTYAALRELQSNQAIGRYDSASNLIDDLLETSDFSDGKSLARLHLAAAAVHAFEGVLPAARWHAQCCRDYSLQHSMPMTAVWGSAFMGLVHFQRNELPDAEVHLRAVLNARFAANWQAIAYSAHALLCAWVEQGRITEAQWVVESVRELEGATGRQMDRRVSDALAAYLALHQDNWTAALQWTRSCVADMPKNMRLSDPELPILAHVLLAQNTPDSLIRAHSGLSELAERKRRINDRLGYYEALVWLASVKRAQNRQIEALDALAEAVAFGQPRGFVRWFVEGGEPVREILTQLLRTNRCAAEANALLAEIARVQRQMSPLAVVASPDPSVEPLTMREFEVLELLAAKLSNKEIAVKLGISPITVRNHTTHVYEKLHVATRQQAVEQAKAHGLLR
jgi:LuxR family maltose regulon positive regulatory protein